MISNKGLNIECILSSQKYFKNFIFLERNTVHLDFNGEIVLLNKIRSHPFYIKVKLTDFGPVGQIPSGQNCIEVVLLRRTRRHRPSKQILIGEVTPGLDMWSLGCCLTESF